MHNTCVAFILTTKTVSTNKTRNKSKKMLYICLLMWNPKMSTTTMHSKKSIPKTIQLQGLRQKIKDLTIVQGQESSHIMKMREHQLWSTLLEIAMSNLRVQISVPNGDCTMEQEVQC